ASASRDRNSCSFVALATKGPILRTLRLLLQLTVLVAALAAVPVASASNDSLTTPTQVTFGVPVVQDISGFGIDPGEPGTANSPPGYTCNNATNTGTIPDRGINHTAWYS